jgi:hypothetical protein
MAEVKSVLKTSLEKTSESKKVAAH